MPPRPPLSQIVIYALGQFGWSLASYGAANLLVYFYLPPGQGEDSLFPPFIYQGAIWGIATLIGLINFSGRLFDAITDPVVALWSDRQPAGGRLGKRRKLMALAALPCALFSFLMFYPPQAEPGWFNNLWVTVSILLFYLALTVYVIPYNALISELGHHPPDRMRISTLISVTFALGFLLGSNTYAIQALFEAWMPPTEAFQLTIGLLALLALLLMLLPVFFLHENRYAHQPEPEGGPVDSGVMLRSVLSNRSFRWFLWSDLMYWLALTFIQLGVSYFITVLMGFETARASAFMTISFLGSFALYWPINRAVLRWGKRRLVLLAFGVFSAIFGLTAWQGIWPMPAEALFWLLAVGASFPLAVFGIVPNALIADLIHEHSQQTGQALAGMFYAVRSFMMKAGISLANLIFPSLLLLGKSPGDALGVQLAAWVAMFACLLGAAAFYRMRH